MNQRKYSQIPSTSSSTAGESANKVQTKFIGPISSGLPKITVQNIKQGNRTLTHPPQSNLNQEEEIIEIKTESEDTSTAEENEDEEEEEDENPPRFHGEREYQGNGFNYREPNTNTNRLVGQQRIENNNRPPLVAGQNYLNYATQSLNPQTIYQVVESANEYPAPSPRFMTEQPIPNTERHRSHPHNNLQQQQRPQHQRMNYVWGFYNRTSQSGRNAKNMVKSINCHCAFGLLPNRKIATLKNLEEFLTINPHQSTISELYEVLHNELKTCGSYILERESAFKSLTEYFQGEESIEIMGNGTGASLFNLRNQLIFNAQSISRLDILRVLIKQTRINFRNVMEERSTYFRNNLNASQSDILTRMAQATQHRVNCGTNQVYFPCAFGYMLDQQKMNLLSNPLIHFSNSESNFSPLIILGEFIERAKERLESSLEHQMIYGNRQDGFELDLVSNEELTFLDHPNSSLNQQRRLNPSVFSYNRQLNSFRSYQRFGNLTYNNRLQYIPQIGSLYFGQEQFPGYQIQSHFRSLHFNMMHSNDVDFYGPREKLYQPYMERVILSQPQGTP